MSYFSAFTSRPLPAGLWLAITLCYLGTAVLREPVSAQDRFSTSDARDRSFSQHGVGTSWQGSDWLSSGGLTSKEWRLGVRGSHTETGFIVSEVAPNSAAQKARIERDDVIIAVGGYQVGMVASRLYDLTEEINRRADSAGVTSLLIQDHISGRLASIRVQLDGNDNSLAGTLEFRDRTPLPSDAVVTVQIENVTRPYYLVKDGLTSLRPIAGAANPFEIAYDPRYIDAQDTYRVVAFVSSGGRMIMQARPQEVLTKGRPSQARLVLEPIVNQTVSTGTGSGVVKAGYPNFNALDDRITQVFRDYLGRAPTALELSAWRRAPSIETRLDTMPLELMAGQEYFDLAGNNNIVWLRTVFRVIIKREPSDDELAKWMQY
ncbi:MAG: YbaY family lipoprotein [Pirellulaceae bacterium]